MVARIVVGDRDQDFTAQVHRALAGAGWDVVEVDGAERALEEIGHASLAAVVLGDVGAEAQAVALCRAIRENVRPGVAIVTLSSSDDYDVVSAMLDAGADDHRLRSIAIVELVERIRVLLRRHADAKDAPGPTKGAPTGIAGTAVPDAGGRFRPEPDLIS